jgi:small subunit ribosomal protein S2
MEALPSAVFLVDVGHEEIAVREARKLNVPIVAVVDTNCSPDGIDFPIPGNDDAMRAIALYAEGIADAVLEGKSSIPEVPTGDDEFVELDESGKPRVEAKAKKPPPKKRSRVTKVRSKGKPRTADEPPPEGEEEAEAGAGAGAEAAAE